MSRTTDQGIKENPCVKFLQWKTIKETVKLNEGTPNEQEVESIKGGTFVYYDKDTKTNVPIDLPLSFVVLNKDLSCYKGYDETKKRGVWSNEVEKPEHVVVISTKGEKLFSFKKSEAKLNKDTIKALGAKYTNSVYIAVPVGKGYEIWNLQLSGAAFSGAPVDFAKPTEEEKKDGWANFIKANKSKFGSHFIDVKTYKSKKKGASKFTIPVFSVGEEIDAETGKIFDELDIQLNEYLAYYFGKPVATTGVADAAVTVDEEYDAETTY